MKGGGGGGGEEGLIKLLNKSQFSGNTKGAYDKKDFL